MLTRRGGPQELEFNTCSTGRIPTDLAALGRRDVHLSLRAKLFYTHDFQYTDFRANEIDIFHSMNRGLPRNSDTEAMRASFPPPLFRFFPKCVF
jgi:hypothetical protein